MDDLKIAPGAAFQHREFRLYAASRFTASVAGMMVGVAVGWQVYDLTRQPMDLGFVGLAQFLPALCVRFSRTRLSSRWFPHRDCLACWKAVCRLGIVRSRQ